MKIDFLSYPKAWSDEFLRFSQDPRGVFLFTGDCGTGKSYAARSIFNSYDRKVGESVFFYRQIDLYESWYSEIRTWGSAKERQKGISEAKLLVVDDLGSKEPSPSFLSFLFDIFDKRFDRRNRVGTIVTTNLSGDELAEYVGKQITSRICSDVVFKFEGADRRFENRRIFKV